MALIVPTSLTTIPSAKLGDFYLLFHRLPFDFSVDLPLALGPGVCLEETPQQWLNSAEPGMADYVLPGYNLQGTGLNNCCLRSYSSSPAVSLDSSNLAFLALIALRLHTPLPIEVAGSFQMGGDDNRFVHPMLYQTASPTSIPAGVYSPADIARADIIAGRLVAVELSGFHRLQTALILFGQITLGACKSFQLSLLGLFAALEALFVPDGNKARTLSRRTASFLGTIQAPEDLEKWLKTEYIERRHKLAHGIHDATFGMRIQPGNLRAFIMLHEIVRLALLGFLSMDDDELSELSQKQGSALQTALDSLGMAKGHLMSDQKMWTE